MTNYIKSILLIILFLLTSLVVLFTPQFKSAALIFYEHLPLIKEQGVRCILSTSLAVQGAVQEFASKAILLYLTFALVAFLLFSLRVKDALAKGISRALTTVLIVGMIGFLYQPYEVPFSSYEVTKIRLDITLTPGDELKTTIRFNAFQDDFKIHLDKESYKAQSRATIPFHYVSEISISTPILAKTD